MRLLLAEDEPLMANALTQMLSRSNYSVDTVYNGQDALDYLLGGDYDGAILDVMMPEIDGITVLKRCRSEGISIPVLLLTAKSEIDDRVEGLDAGADDYLTKPFDAKELLARVRSMMRRQPSLQEKDLHFSDITLDRTGYSLIGPDTSVKLTGKEYQMLEMFLSNPQQTISTEHFLEKIWGYDSESEINVVWVNLSSIRKKLQQVGSGVQIKAARGLGYSLEAREE